MPSTLASLCAFGLLTALGANGELAAEKCAGDQALNDDVVLLQTSVDRASSRDAKAKTVLSRADNALMQTRKMLARRLLGCHPGTKLFGQVPGGAFGPAPFEPGQCKPVGMNLAAFEFCGPGTLRVSPNSCDDQDYKADSFTHSESDYSTNCETISLTGTIAEGFLGSFSVSCDAALLKTSVQQASSRGVEAKTSRRLNRCQPGTKLFGQVPGGAFGPAPFEPGQCKPVGMNLAAFEFCGPGTLRVSPNSCDEQDYQADSFTHSESDYSTNCETISLTGTIAEGFLGSFSVTC